MLNILVPLDGSALSERAIPHALAMARAFAARVTLLRVITPAEFRAEDTFSQVDWRLCKRQARTYLEDVATTIGDEGVPTELLVEEGRPADAILEAAHRLDARLLVMSTHGRGGAVEFPHGGVAGKVLSMFTSSVLLVGSHGEVLPRESAGYTRLLVPIDGAHRSECSLRVAVMLAQSLSASLTVACVAPPPRLPLILRRDRKAQTMCRELGEMTRRAAEQSLIEIRARVPEQLELDTLVIMADDVEDPIEEAIRRSGAQLVIADMELCDAAYAHPPVPRSVGDVVPVLMLNPAAIADVFSDALPAYLPDVPAADVS
jgi:nucleotide-binding universal stress UspA family protein